MLDSFLESVCVQICYTAGIGNATSLLLYGLLNHGVLIKCNECVIGLSEATKVMQFFLLFSSINLNIYKRKIIILIQSVYVITSLRTSCIVFHAFTDKVRYISIVIFIIVLFIYDLCRRLRAVAPRCTKLVRDQN